MFLNTNRFADITLGLIAILGFTARLCIINHVGETGRGVTMAGFETADGLRLDYSDQAGIAPPILCLAGLKRNKSDFDYLVRDLDRPNRIIRLDCRGRGASDHDPDWANCNVAVEATDALALMDHLSIPQAVVIGTSRGGVLGMVMEATRPGAVRALVLSDVGPDVDYEDLKRILSYIGMPPPYRTMDDAARDFAAKLKNIFVGRDHRYFLDIVERSYAVGPDGPTLNYDPRLRDATEAQMKVVATDGHGLWPIFALFSDIPVLALKAEHSDILSASTLQKMVAMKPDLRHTTIPGVGHIPRLNEPEALAAIRDLLDSL